MNMFGNGPETSERNVEDILKNVNDQSVEHISLTQTHAIERMPKKLKTAARSIM